MTSSQRPKVSDAQFEIMNDIATGAKRHYSLTVHSGTANALARRKWTRYGPHTPNLGYEIELTTEGVEAWEREKALREAAQGAK